MVDAQQAGAPQRSWMAYIPAGLGGSALPGVLAFHFPTLLTSRDFRAAYTGQFARTLLLVVLIASFVLGTIAVLRGRSIRVALGGVCCAALAVFLGGARQHEAEFRLARVPARHAAVPPLARSSVRRRASGRTSTA